MSVTGSQSGIYFSGLSSGVDTDSIITKLMQIESTAVQRVKDQQTQIASRQAALTALQGQLTTFSTSAAALNNPSVFTTAKASSSDTTVATVTATSDATAGVFDLKVSKLAFSHKIGSTNISSTSTALGWPAGTFIVNGKGIAVSETDSLSSISQKINAANTGVTATIIDGGTNNAYLTLTANSSGKAAAIQVADLTGSTIASRLGLTSGATSYRETITDGVTSSAISSANTSLSSVFNTTGVGTKTFNLNGTDIAINFDTQNLADIANAINTSGSGATASVRTVTNSDNTTSYKLDIKGITSNTDADGALQAIGVLQQGYTSEISKAQDAEYKIDNLSMTSASNTISSVIPGVTLTLLKADVASPPTTTVTLTRDNQATIDKVKAFVSAYNNVQSFITTNSQMDSTTYETGLLFGDPVAQQTEAQLSGIVFNTVSGLNSRYTNMMQFGLTMDTTGALVLDESKLTDALNTDPTAVGAVFRATGTGSNDSISYVSNTSKTVASGTSPYVIGVTQLATQSSYESFLAQTSPSTVAETLSFSGNSFGSTPYTLNLEIGSTLTSTISKINNDAKLKDILTAVNDGGTLKLVTKKYGSLANFAVSSNLDAGADNSGIGKNNEGTTVNGVDMAGTINGESATGTGQFLIGTEGNSTTSGLQIMYTGTTIGSNVGTISFSKGIGAQLFDLVSSYKDPVNGLFASTDHELQTQTDELTQQINDMNAAAATKEQELRDKFSAMETAMENLKSQQAQLNALLGTSSSSS